MSALRKPRALALLLLAAVVAPLAAQQPPRPITPQDFAWQFPIETAGADGVVRFTLTPEIYARVTRPDLADLAAFNAAGESIPLGPAALASDRLAPPPPPSPVQASMFRVPRGDASTATGDSVELHISRGADGRLTQLDAEIAPQAATQAVHDILLDLSNIHAPVTALTLELDELSASGLSARVDVEASDDLASWQPLARGLAVISLREGGLVLERRRLEIPATEQPYLRLRRSDSEMSLPVRAVQAIVMRRGMAPEVPLQTLKVPATADAAQAGTFQFSSGGHQPVQRIEIALADANTISSVIVESRDGPDEPWRERARTVAFRLGSGPDAIASSPIELPAMRDRHWRLRTDPVQLRAPSVSLSYRADEFVMLTQGAGPYYLAAGSLSARRPEYPLRTVLAEMQSINGDLWLPPEASVGAGSSLSGDAALTAPPPPPPYKTWLLWGVLVAGAIGVLWMVLSLLRGSAPAPDESR